MFESGGFLDRHVKAECFELSHMATDRALGVTPVEVVGAEFVVRDAVAHDVYAISRI